MVQSRVMMKVADLTLQTVKVLVTAATKLLETTLFKSEQERLDHRKFLPTLSELVDRLSIIQLKELLIPEHRAEYSAEIRDILFDIDQELVERDVRLTSREIRAFIVLAIMNREIWLNESNYRKGIVEGNNLGRSHGLNSIRNYSKNRIQEKIGGRKDYKLDSVEAAKEWIPSWE